MTRVLIPSRIESKICVVIDGETKDGLIFVQGEEIKKSDIDAGAKRLGLLDSCGKLLKEVEHYAVALGRWAAAGFPTRTQEQAEACEAVCRACPGGHYDQAKEGCKVCGCCTSSKRWAVKSKVKMGTEDCPKGYWQL